MYIGVTFIEALNVFIEGAILIAEASVISMIEGTAFVRSMYIILAILSFVLAIVQVIMKFSFHLVHLCKVGILCQVNLS